MILLDASDQHAQPGALLLLRKDVLPRCLSHKLSPHQLDLREVLAIAELRDKLPRHLLAIGVQPESVELTGALSPRVSEAIPRLVDLVVEQLRWLGHRCVRREAVHA